MVMTLIKDIVIDSWLMKLENLYAECLAVKVSFIANDHNVIYDFLMVLESLEPQFCYYWY